MRISILLAAILSTFALVQPTCAQTSGATVTSAPGRVEMAQAMEASAVHHCDRQGDADDHLETDEG